MRERVRRRFPKIAHLGGVALSPLYSIQFALQAKPDRRILEEVVFPALLNDASIHRILFVGCAWYTRGYVRQFVDRDFWTIDTDEKAKRYGGPRHVVGSFTNLSRYFVPESLDAIICNGVIGFGLNSRDEAEVAFAECFSALRPGGLLVLGWDDVDQFRPFLIDELVKLHAFDRHALPPFTSWRYPTFSRLQHTFDFYRRPASPGERTADGRT